MVLLMLLLAGGGRTAGLAVADAALPEAGAAMTTTSTTEKTTAATTTIAEPSAAASTAAATAPDSAAAAAAPDTFPAPEDAKTAEAEAAPEKESEAADASAAAASAVAQQADPSAAAAAASVPPLAAPADAAPVAATATAAAAPTSASAEARASDLLKRANAVLALRRAGLLPGTGALDPAMASKTVEAVNANAPAFEAAGGVSFRPSLTQTVGEGGSAAAPAPAPSKPVSLRAKWAGADAWAAAPASTVIESYASKWRPTVEGAQNSTLAARNRTAGGGLPFNLGSVRVQAAAAGAPSASESVEAEAAAEAAAAPAAAAPAPAQMRVTTLANGTRIMSPTQPGTVAANALIGESREFFVFSFSRKKKKKKKTGGKKLTLFFSSKPNLPPPPNPPGEYGPLREGESIGAVIQVLFGFRIATPFFGTGFNFCVDRYWGSFPKVGIVVPNAASWLLPDLAKLFADNGGIQANLDLPTANGGGLPAGATAEASSDGLVVWLPSVQPLYISNLGFRFGLQIAQLFGIDFGFGLLKIGCRVDFVRV